MAKDDQQFEEQKQAGVELSTKVELWNSKTKFKSQN